MAIHSTVNPAVTYVILVLQIGNVVPLVIEVFRPVTAANRRTKAQMVQRAALYSAAVCLMQGLICMLDQNWFGMWLFAALMAASLILWWISGGGDGTKRRLRKLKEKFEGKRRTAPVTA